jgi:glycosyltransferase involved in cell wall biosynthesis
VFHQNKERHLLRKITNVESPREAKSMRVGLFTDTFDEVNGVGRFIRDMGARGKRAGFNLKIHTCQALAPSPGTPGEGTGEGPDPNPSTPRSGRTAEYRERGQERIDRTNFTPLLSRPLPYYSDLKLNLPPVLDILESSDREQFDAIHVSTPGPMGLVGWLVSKMLRVPMLATYHTDFPAYVDKLTGDHRVANGTAAYMKWFYSQAHTVFVRSAAYRFKLMDLGIDESKIRVLPAGVDTERFNASHRHAALESAPKRRLLYVGRVSVEKNLPMLVEILRRLCSQRGDVELTIAGDGPYFDEMKRQLANLPAHFCGVQNDESLAHLYASSDLFIFPSRTDTLGQVVLEAQACGLPAIVSSEGGPKETVVDDLTGRVLISNDPADWCEAISSLLDDEPRRQRMSQAAIKKSARFSLTRTFDAFWHEHLSAIAPLEKPPVPPAVEVTIPDLSRPSKHAPSL